jgi:regulator of sigma E protease
MATVLVFAFVISVLVVVHELGHHLMAKRFRVPVEIFSVGFGPKLLGFRRGETEYRLSAILLGGYVKMAGTADNPNNPTAHGFNSKPRWQRFLILLAGPAMNIAFALVLAIVGLWVGIEVPTQSGATVIYRPGFFEAFLVGGRAIADSSTVIILTIAGLITGDISLNALMGPVGLAQIAGQSAEIGWRAMLAAMAFVSLNLGLCNLLPIPILDGGQMVVLTVEGMMRRTLPFPARRAVAGVGAFALLLLLATTLYNDIGRLGLLNP